MELTLERPGDHLFVRSCSDEGIVVVDELHTRSIILTADQVITDWNVESAGALGAPELDRILDLSPEIVIVGTGRRQIFLPPQLMVHLYRGGAGAEVMSTEAACRTFNVLVSELRNVAAALIIDDNP